MLEMPPKLRLLTRENYTKGCLVDDEAIGGVTAMADGLFAAYVSHYLTGETYAYEEFTAVEPALSFLAAIDRPWVYEAIGCSTKTAVGKTSSGCATGGCSTTGCGAGRCR